ncbi:hypothetical protein [Candidatus Protochlamydia amoebophila]|uniref:Uncharacterized protein n=1 Tax=Candidatus Protochlamydia amoebophila TaxID=362787 RepID=A0A0C1H7T4_9BACT|nr:hypothetical protein [Candidatus Protochlamydia amoebophila]KIC70953.1 hypothetical protein DB44_FE00040 [Candidatus Protochlamydia amoebophila]
MCPVCPPVSFLGGLLGGYCGVNPPTTFKGHCISLVSTATLVTTTVVALKVLFRIPFCYGTGFTFSNVSFILAKTLVLGVIYSMGVNFLLNRFASHDDFSQEYKNPLQLPQGCSHCTPF